MEISFFKEGAVEAVHWLGFIVAFHIASHNILISKLEKYSAELQDEYKMAEKFCLEQFKIL